jgi:hypothetical protein
MKRGKAIKRAFTEYAGTMAEEKYRSKAAMMKHEKSELKSEEKKEEQLSKIKKNVGKKRGY